MPDKMISALIAASGICLSNISSVAVRERLRKMLQRERLQHAKENKSSHHPFLPHACPSMTRKNVVLYTLGRCWRVSFMRGVRAAKGGMGTARLLRRTRTCLRNLLQTQFPLVVYSRFFLKDTPTKRPFYTL